MQEPQNAILNSAIKLFSALPYDRVSIRLIAKDSCITHSLIHRHWGSKGHLFADAVDQAARRLTNDMFPYGTDVDTIDLAVLIGKVLQHKDAAFFRILYQVNNSPDALAVFEKWKLGLGIIRIFEERLKEYNSDIPEFSSDTFFLGLLMVLHLEQSSAVCAIMGWDKQRIRAAQDQVSSAFLRATYNLHKL